MLSRFLRRLRWLLPAASVVAAGIWLMSWESCSGDQERRDSQTRSTPALEAALDSAGRLVDDGRDAAALEYIDEVYRRQHPTIKDLHEKYWWLYRYYMPRQNSGLAMQYADSMGSIIQDAGLIEEMPTDFAMAEFSKGDVLFETGLYSDGIDCYYQARAIGLGRFDTCILSNYSYRLAMILYRQERYTEAVSSFKSALSEKKSAGDNSFKSVYHEQELLDNIGLSYERSGQYDSACRYYDEALAFIDANFPKFPLDASKFNVAKAVALGNLGGTLASMGRLNEADTVLMKSLWINDDPLADKNDALLTLIKLAKVRLAQGNLKGGYAMLQPHLRMVDSSGDAHLKHVYYLEMSHFADSLGQKEAAFSFLKRANTEEDKRALASHWFKEVNMDAQINKMQAAYQNGILKKDLELRQTYLLFAIGFAALLLAGSVLFYRNWNRSRQIVRKLNWLNKSIDDQRRELEAALKNLQENAGEKDRIINVVAHDMRSPAASVSWLAAAMLDDGDLSLEQRENLELIKAAAENSISLSREILEAFTLLNSYELRRSAAGVQKIIRQQTELLRHAASEKSVRIRTSLPPDEIVMELDSTKIGRIVNNLLSNAIKFSQPHAEVVVGMEVRREAVLISVSDTGIGIPKDIQKSIFDSFTESKRYGTNGEKPYGLGLSICRHLTEMHSGEIWVNSSPAKGSVFFVRLPFASNPVVPKEQQKA